MDVLTFIGQCAWYMLPMGLANMAPVLFRHRLGFLAVPVDRLFGLRNVFGDHKTVRGIVVAVFFGGVWFWWQQLVASTPWAQHLSLFDYKAMSIGFGFVAGLGAIVGDLVRSAVKRRFGIRPGGKFVPWDQIDYLLGGMLFTAPFYQPTLGIALTTLAVGFILHILVSRTGYALGMKRDRL